MKFALKSLVVAAAVVASGVASAGIVNTVPGEKVIVVDPLGSGRKAEMSLISGGGTLEFSNGTGVMGGTPTGSVGGLVGALNVGKVTVKGVEGVTASESSVKIGRDTVRGSISMTSNVNALSADNVSGQILSVGIAGGAEMNAGYLSGVLGGGRITVKNLKFDLVNKTVFADLYGQKLNDDDTLAPVVTSLNTALWTIGSIVGPTTIPPEALLAAGDGDMSKMLALGYTLESTAPVAGDPDHMLYTVKAIDTLSGLKVTDAGFKFFADAMGLAPGSTGYTTLAGVNGQIDGWGSAKSTIIFTARELPAVPEPSTYALMGVGLVCVGLAAARRRAK